MTLHREPSAWADIQALRRFWKAGRTNILRLLSEAIADIGTLADECKELSRANEILKTDLWNDQVDRKSMERDLLAECDSKDKRIAALRRELAEARKALEFYALKSRYQMGDPYMGGGSEPSAMDHEAGAMARAFLSAHPEAKT